MEQALVHTCIKDDGGTPNRRCPACEAEKQPRYPEHEKLKRVHDRSQACGEFIEWLSSEKKIQLGQRHRHTDECYQKVEVKFFGMRDQLTCGMLEDNLYLAAESVVDLLAEFFEIDQKKLEEEKRTMLDIQRKLNDQTS